MVMDVSYPISYSSYCMWIIGTGTGGGFSEGSERDSWLGGTQMPSSGGMGRKQGEAPRCLLVGGGGNPNAS